MIRADKGASMTGTITCRKTCKPKWMQPSKRSEIREANGQPFFMKDCAEPATPSPK